MFLTGANGSAGVLRHDHRWTRASQPGWFSTRSGTGGTCRGRPVTLTVRS